MQEVMSNGDVVDYGDVKQFKLPEVKRYFDDYDQSIKSEQLIKVNLRKEAEKGLKSGRDFLVTNHIAIDKDGNKTVDGIFSPNYGYTQFDNQSGRQDAYRCQCGETGGAIAIDEICAFCGTPVKFMDADLNIMGWIPLQQYVVINPSMYTHMNILFGKGELENILKLSTARWSVDGTLKDDVEPRKRYHNVGMMHLYKHIDQVLDFYRDLDTAGKKRDHYEILVENRDAIFTNYIPVYSAIIRPHIENNEKVRAFKPNKLYGMIMSQYNLIISEPDNELTIVPALHGIQQKLNDLYGWLVDTYSGKEGMFRSNFGGVRIDYAARSIIIPGIHLKPNEVEIPYISGIVFLELELIHLLCILDDITENEAYKIINDSLRIYNPRVHALMMTILKESKTPICVMVGRPPTLSDRSIRLLQVVSVGNDIDNLCMRISPSLLDGYAGDHDGDSLYYFPMKDWRLIKTFEPTLSPKYNYVSRTHGRYSERMKFIKDYILILSELYALGENAS